MNNGINDAYLEYGDYFSYNKTARAQIFKRDQVKVVNIDSMIKLMRFFLELLFLKFLFYAELKFFSIY